MCGTTERKGGKTEGREKKMFDRIREGEKKRRKRQGKEIVNVFMYLARIHRGDPSR